MNIARISNQRHMVASRHAVPPNLFADYSATSSWLGRVAGAATTKSRPVSSNPALGYIVAGDGLHGQGAIRTIVPNSSEDGWSLADGPSGNKVIAAIVNDYVEVGDVVYLPQPGIRRTVRDVPTEGEHITGIRVDGVPAEEDPVRLWMRVQPHQVTATDAPKPEGEAALAQAIAERDEWERKWYDLWEALNQQAIDRGWCSEYQDFVEENGGPEITQDYVFDVTLEACLQATRDLDSALSPLLNDKPGVRCDITEEVEVKHDVQVTMRFGSTTIEDEQTRHDLIDARLREDGWIFDDFTITAWDLA